MVFVLIVDQRANSQHLVQPLILPQTHIILQACSSVAPVMVVLVSIPKQTLSNEWETGPFEEHDGVRVQTHDLPAIQNPDFTSFQLQTPCRKMKRKEHIIDGEWQPVSCRETRPGKTQRLPDLVPRSRTTQQHTCRTTAAIQSEKITKSIGVQSRKKSKLSPTVTLSWGKHGSVDCGGI